MSEELIAGLDRLAEEEGRTRNAVIVRLLSDGAGVAGSGETGKKSALASGRPKKNASGRPRTSRKQGGRATASPKTPPFVARCSTEEEPQTPLQVTMSSLSPIAAAILQRPGHDAKTCRVYRCGQCRNLGHHDTHRGI